MGAPGIESFVVEPFVLESNYLALAKGVNAARLPRRRVRLERPGKAAYRSRIGKKRASSGLRVAGGALVSWIQEPR